jgi:acetyl-CoA carboxylase biotin carboxyl carrier protein
VELNWNELRELLSTLSQTDIAELNIKSGDFELTVRKGGAFSDRPLAAEPDRSSVVPAPLPAPVPAPLPAVSAPAPAPHANDRLIDIVAPVVGTFYRAPGPDEASFVEVGDRIRLGQTVCIIEAMKIMNEIEAEVVGEVVEILVQNAQPVEFGQVLMRVNPG